MNESLELQAIRAQARLHHALLLGLELMVSSRKGPGVMGDWMFRLFRRQHHDKFLSSFQKLGLSDLPDAVACARYHVLANNMGGVGVEYMEESDRKAWVRFRYPRWMYDGPVVCGLPVEVSRGFLKGWYAHNGVSLNNPRLGFVCVSEDMTGEFGFCGYFREFDRDLRDDERLQFAKDELPPPFNPESQPKPPENQWTPIRLEKANRNYALEYVRNGLCELVPVIGADETSSLAKLAARLIGLQYFSETSEITGTVDGDLDDFIEYLTRMFVGMGDELSAADTTDRTITPRRTVTLRHTGLRVVRGLDGAESRLVLECWCELWRGAAQANRELKSLDFVADADGITWKLENTVRR